MKRMLFASFFVTAAMLTTAAALSSQHHPEPHHGHHHRMAAPGYDPATVVTRHCTVESVDELASGGCQGCEGGIHLRGSCGGEKCDIHLGPASYVKGKNFPLAKGDEVEVEGSRVPYDGGTSLIAKEVRKGDAVLELRDDRGLPLWRKGAR